MKSRQGALLLVVSTLPFLGLATLVLFARFVESEARSDSDMETFNRSSGWYYEETFFTKEALSAYFHDHPCLEEFSEEGFATKSVFASTTATNYDLENAPRLVHTSHFISLAKNDSLSRSARHTLSFFPDARFVVVNSSIAPDELRGLCELSKIKDVCIYSPKSSRTTELKEEVNQLQEAWPQKRIWFTSASRFFHE